MRIVYSFVHMALALFLSTGILATPRAEITYVTRPRWYNVWEAESLFAGAGLLAIDSNRSISVVLKGSRHTDAVAETHFMVPGHHDSSRFLFHNLHEQFPEESTTINLGTYPVGTPIVFMYMIVDTSEYWEELRNKRFFTGQNREGVDQYVSDIAPVNQYGRRFSIAGKCGGNTAEVGICDDREPTFKNVILEVTEVSVEVIEHNKIPYLHVTPDGEGPFTDSVPAGLWVPDSGLLAVKDRDTISNPLAEGEQLRIYYTLDGTDPRTSQSRQLYEGEFQITQTCTLKAYAELTGETNWYPSEVTTRAFTVDASGLARHIGVPAGRLPERIQPGSQVTLLHASGRIVGRFSAVECRSLLAHSRLAPGVYFIKYRGRGGTHTRSFAVTAE